MNKSRFKNYFQDAIRGAVLIARISPRLTTIVLTTYVLLSLLPLLSLMVLKYCLDSLIPPGEVDYNSAILYFGLFVFINVCAVIVNQFSTYQQSIHQHKVSEYFSNKVLDKAAMFKIEEYENPQLYNDLHLVHQQTIYKPAMFLSIYQGLIQSSIVVLLLAGFLLTVHWLFPVLLMLVSIPLAINKLLYGYKQYSLEKANIPLERRANDLYTYLTTEPFAKEVRIFNYSSAFISKFLQLKENIFLQKKKISIRFLKSSIILQVIEAVIIGGAYFFLINQTISNAITIGGLVIYIQMFQRFQSAINSLFQSGIGLFQHHLYLRNVLHYIERPVDRFDVGKTKPLPQDWKQLEVKGLSFTYPNTKRAVLTDINMSISSGEIVAIVGENGSGKSTLVKLISRLYEPETNMISLDGRDVTEYEKEDWWKNTSILLQDYGKYSLTVEENISLASHTDNAKIKYVADLAGVETVVQKLDDGYQTMLGRSYKKGAQLSGGQWQKLAIARSLYKEANLLILDEPTSSLDPISEHKLINEIKATIDNKVVVLVTHKLYNLKMVDRIFVMSEGKIVEQGTFEELVNNKHTFFNNYQKQLA